MYKTNFPAISGACFRDLPASIEKSGGRGRRGTADVGSRHPASSELGCEATVATLGFDDRGQPLPNTFDPA